MNSLLINTANKDLTLVLKIENKVFLKQTDSNIKHNESMLPLIDLFLKEHSLDITDINEFGIVVGPGSFTGIRVGIATVKAFRDVIGRTVFGINNLDLLYNLATNQDSQIDTVAIAGSKDSYFVAKRIGDTIYKYERNLSLKELVELAGKSKIGMYEQNDELNHLVVKMDAKVFVSTFETLSSESLQPIYYQLSQAENEKIKHAKIDFALAALGDLDTILEIDSSCAIGSCPWNKDNYKTMIMDELSDILFLKLDDIIVGYICLANTIDEMCIENIVVRKDYRNLGLGTKLIEETKKLARSKQLSILSLEVSAKNITAYNLYKKLGFQTRRIRKNFYEQDHSDAYEMELKLT